jgi:hypothetical protein
MTIWEKLCCRVGIHLYVGVERSVHLGQGKTLAIGRCQRCGYEHMELITND